MSGLDLSNRALQGLEAWTTDEVHVRYRAVATRMLENISERKAVGEELPHLKAEHDRVASRSRIERKNEAIESGDKLTSADLDALVTLETVELRLAHDLCDERRRALEMEARTLDSILGMLRSVGRDSRDLGGGVR